MKRQYSIIALISLSLISLEIVWTRLFSAEFYYTFAFLILSVAVMGLGLGGLLLRLIPSLARKENIGIYLLLSGLSVILSPVIIFSLGLEFSELYSSALMMFKFVFATLLLALPYLAGGLALTLLFRSDHKNLNKLYMADMSAAGIGVILAIMLMNNVSTPKAMMFISVPLLLASILTLPGLRKALPSLTIVLAIVLSFSADNLLEATHHDRGKVLYTEWDAMSKIRIVEYNDVTRGIRIDNAAQTSVYRFGGNWQSGAYTFQINVANLIHRFDKCCFLSLGAGGGVDVLHALQENAAEVHAVEVNPLINSMMTKGDLADYTGRIYHDPRVKVVTEDARSYIRRFSGKFNVIYALSSNSFAALASGAFALAENYLFTEEAIADYWNALSAKGFMMIEHHFYIPRVVSEAMNSLKKLCVSNPEKHFAVYSLPRMKRSIIILSKQPLTTDIINSALGVSDPNSEAYYQILYPAGAGSNLITEIVANGWQSVQNSWKTDISPCTDNKPFIAQMGLWKNLDLFGIDKVVPFEYYGFPLSKLNIVVIIFIVILILIPLNLIPYKISKAKLRLYPWLYFFAIGVGFMSLEVVLIQKYTLLIGTSVYSTISILLALLLASGIGSRFSSRFGSMIIFGSIVAWIILEISIFGQLTAAAGKWELMPRIITTIILIAPLGFFLGMPFPKGGMIVGELIDWGFAINGAASVLGSTIVLLIAFSWGFSAALAFGAIMYVLAYLLIRNKKAWLS